MKKKGIYRYKDPQSYIRKQEEYIRNKYKLVQLAFDREKDAEIISRLEKCRGAKTEEVRKWYEKYKGSN